MFGENKFQNGNLNIVTLTFYHPSEKSSPSKKVQKQREEQQQEKKKAAKKKTAPKSKRKKRAMTFSSGDDDEEDENNLSEDESELDDIVDNIENYNSVEDEAESEEWDLPNGVNYDDTPCSAPRCKNPVGERVDWVSLYVSAAFLFGAKPSVGNPCTD